MAPTTEARLLNGLGIVLSGWLLFPVPYGLAIAAVAAWPLVAAIRVMRSRGCIRFDGPKDSDEPMALVAVVVPALSLAVRALHDYDVYDDRLAMAIAAPIALALTLLMKRADKKLSLGLILLLAANAHYGYALALYVNGLFERGAPMVFETTVLGKHANRGKGTTLLLRLGPWGPVREEEEVVASHQLYEQLDAGAMVRIELRTGALGIRTKRIAR